MYNNGKMMGGVDCEKETYTTVYMPRHVGRMRRDGSASTANTHTRPYSKSFDGSGYPYAFGEQKPG